MQHLKIQEDYISLFASGSSVLHLSSYELELIRKKSFVITTNYAPVYLKGHLNAWSDRAVTTFLEKHYEQHPKECLFLSRDAAFMHGQEFKFRVDHWFNNRSEGLQGNFTAGWVLQLLKKYFPEKTILLFGWDFYPGKEKEKWYDQYTEYDSKRRGAHYRLPQKLLTFAEQIRTFQVDRSRIFNCNPDSCLDFFEKRHWTEILGLNVLHLTNSSLAGAPVHLSHCLNKYSHVSSRAFLRQEFSQNSKLSNLRWNYDRVGPRDPEIKVAEEWADVIHYHQRPYPGLVTHKSSLLQFHAQPNGYRPEQTHPEFNERKLVIAQYHPRFYTDARIIPNLIDIWKEEHTPGFKDPRKIKIFYSWASEVKVGWGNKGSSATIQVLNRVSEKFGDQVQIVVFNNEPYEKCLQEKRSAHICIDECVTGSYHLQSLEGCAAGAVTINNIDEVTLGFLQEVTGTKGHPFFKSDLTNLYESLCGLISDPVKLRQEGKRSRAWMEENWDPRKLSSHFVKAYRDIITYNSLKSRPLAIEQQPLMVPVSEPVRLEPAPGIISLPPPVNISSFPEPVKNVPLSLPGRNINELHGQFEGKDIYILGTGPSLFKANPQDFNDKICFSINYAFEKIPHIAYYFAHVIEVFKSIQPHVPNGRFVLPETLVPQYHRNKTNELYKTRIAPDCGDAYIYPLQDVYARSLRERTVGLERDSRIFNWSTTTHSAIHLAAFMGAKRIFLVGVDYSPFPNGRVHFETPLNPDYSRQDWSANAKHRQGDHWLRDRLKEAGIELIYL